MNAAMIVTTVGNVLGLITQILPLVGVKNTEAIGGIVKTITDMAPLVTDQISATYTGVKNIIASVSKHPATTEEQLASLRAFNKQVDEAWDVIELQLDPDASGNS